MADNVQFQSTQLATPASGTTVSTDEAASGHIQRVKLAYSADGVDTHVTADASGLLVNTGSHIDDVVNAVATTDQAITTKSAVFGYTTSGGGSFQPVKVTPSGALTVEVNDGGGSITVDGTVAATQSGTWNINNVAGTISLPTGAATETSVAAVAATASGSNLRVTMANPLPTTSSAAMVTSVAASASSVQLLASNDARRGFAIFNDSGASCYIRFGTTASTTTFTVRLDGNAFFESGATIYTGRIDAIWSTASGSARITEW